MESVSLLVAERNEDELFAIAIRKGVEKLFSDPNKGQEDQNDNLEY